jgi:hypothetical protein
MKNEWKRACMRAKGARAFPMPPGGDDGAGIL